MRRAPIASLKAKLSEYLDAVRAGEEIVVTERGRPIARLGPIGVSAGQESRVAALVRAGLARPPLRRLPADFLKQRGPADRKGRSLAVLLEERAEGR
jgi:prevent-host-death family protein